MDNGAFTQSFQCLSSKPAPSAAAPTTPVLAGNRQASLDMIRALSAFFGVKNATASFAIEGLLRRILELQGQTPPAGNNPPKTSASAVDPREGE
jgi:hypothetical protein